MLASTPLVARTLWQQLGGSGGTLNVADVLRLATFLAWAPLHLLLAYARPDAYLRWRTPLVLLSRLQRQLTIVRFAALFNGEAVGGAGAAGVAASAAAGASRANGIMGMLLWRPGSVASLLCTYALPLRYSAPCALALLASTLHSTLQQCGVDCAGGGLAPALRLFMATADQLRHWLLPWELQPGSDGSSGGGVLVLFDYGTHAQLGAGSGGGSATGGAVCRPPAAFVADGPYVLGEEAQAAEVLKLVGLLPPSVRGKLEQHPELPLLLEVVMDLGRPPLARFPSGDLRLAEGPVSPEDLQYAVDQVGNFGGDNRAGIDKTLHRISCIRNRAGRVVGLTCRVGRAIAGSAAMVADLARSGKSILLLGRPGVGKTTAIREISRLLADECQRRVVIVDTSNEIGGDGDIPHPGIGRARRMQVPHPEQQHRVMIEAVENHMPEVIVIDEIGTEAECLAARTIAQRGVQLVATAHGNELENLLKNPSLSDLVGGISSVTLGDDEAKRRGVQKSVLERQSPPTFDACVEMASREQWRVHLDVAWAVDMLLTGREAGAEVRERDETGKVWSWPEGGSTDFEEEEDDETLGGGGGGSASAGRRRGGARAQQQQLQLETQPFPAEALTAARMGAALQAAEEAGVDLPLALRAAAAARASSSGRPTSSSGGGSTAGSTAGSSPGGGFGKPADPAAVHIYAFGLDNASVAEIAQSLGVGTSLVVAERLQDADAVLALRAKIKSSGSG
ncbi:nucleic acid-binding [Micractinium conductrix]|uniref:Nucleic acid-binding n=1 Tax=Micractinium conductrix TaxID=554055 RepID=A0A2P6VNR2_9CHLO|nr:nucleic acid-binding [Micractinium conductrix]|eukprot:PSC75743.1 nucleic acid-binding [Micractinium conductrix]